jgi:dCMP deaminase
VAKKVAFLYLPVMHEGYVRFLTSCDFSVIYILGEEITHQYRDLVKDIRAIPAQTMCRLVSALLPRVEIVEVVDTRQISRLNSSRIEVHVPDETISREIASSFFPRAVVHTTSIFLRWDSENSQASTIPKAQRIVSGDSVIEKLFNLAYQEAFKSADWWRQVGAVLISASGRLISAHNHHVPHEQMPYINGDPRTSFTKGVNVEYGTALHAEMAIMAEAARLGISTNGAELVTSTFPCQWCAKILAYSGMKTVYFVEGYAVLDAQTILESQGIEIVRIEL